MKPARLIIIGTLLAIVLSLGLGAPAQAEDGDLTYGIDFSRWTTNPDTFILAAQQQGYQFIAGYVTSPGKPAKVITAARLEACLRLDMPLILFFEESASRPLAGYWAGVWDSYKVADALTRLGLPRWTPVYFCCDCGASAERVAAYYRGIKDTFGFPQGGYGGGRVVTYLLDHGLIGFSCQTAPWSLRPYGKVIWDPRATMYQPGITARVAYRNCDVLWATQQDFGQIPRP